MTKFKNVGDKQYIKVDRYHKIALGVAAEVGTVYEVTRTADGFEMHKAKAPMTDRDIRLMNDIDFWRRMFEIADNEEARPRI